MFSPVHHRPVRDASAILDVINAVTVPTSDKKEHYTALRGNEKLPETSIVKMINALEIEEFIPAKIAILLKLNWHDRDFCSALLSNIVADLRDKRGAISPRLADHILDKIEKGLILP
jgi:hypothetical protein